MQLFRIAGSGVVSHGPAAPGAVTRFVIVQTHAAKKPEIPFLKNIRHVANYWNHRDQRNSACTPDKNGVQLKTIEGVRGLGACPPAKLGQLEKVAEAALGQRLDADTLWNAVET